MNEPLKQSSETFTVEQGYYIAMMFFFKLWHLLPQDMDISYQKVRLDFFIDIPCNDRHCAEWNEAVCRLTEIPKEKQRTLSLTILQIFQCTLEYFKLHNKCYEDRLSYILNLKSMKEEPDKYQAEWKVWKKAVQYVKDFRMNRQTFDWDAEPAFSYE